MLRLLVALGPASVLVAGCGGKIDGTPGSPPSPSPTVTGTVTAPIPTTTSSPTSSPPPPSSVPVAASSIADAYCSTFSTCCQSLNATVDVARCRAVTTAAVMKRIEGVNGAPTPGEVAMCSEAVRARTSACGKEDVKWWLFDEDALFGPASVRRACRTLVGPRDDTASACNTGKACPAGEVCAIDECTSAAPTGAPCGDDEGCLDGGTCDGKVCYVRLTVRPSFMCSEDASCRLGFGCFSGLCQTARAGGVYEERHSPYRVASDTCKIFNYL